MDEVRRPELVELRLPLRRCVELAVRAATWAAADPSPNEQVDPAGVVHS